MAKTMPSSAVPSDGGPLAFVIDLDDPVLDDEDHHHLARVRRIRDGDQVIVSDGQGHWRRARMSGHRPEPEGDTISAPRPEPPVGVAFALVKGSKPELVVQKLTELGVDHIRPFVAARSVVRWDHDRSDSAHRRFIRVAREAAMQSRRSWLPEVHRVSTFTDVAGQPGAARANRGGRPPGLDHPLLLVGPEGGWDVTETRTPIAEVGLGAGVLRAETAAIAAGVVLVALREGVLLPA